MTRPPPPPPPPVPRGDPVVAAVLLAVLAYALLMFAIVSLDRSPADRVTDEVRSRLDPAVQADGPAAPAEECREIVITDEYGADVAIMDCPGEATPAGAHRVEPTVTATPAE